MYIILVLVNFSADSYRATVNFSSVVVLVMAFGPFNIPFTVEVRPDAVDTTSRGKYIK